jgi:hypothetical protein
MSEACRAATCSGLYRIRSGQDSGLAYVGQGIVASRLRAHQAKALSQGHRQGPYFSGSMSASWVPLPGMPALNILEHENDLIAAHMRHWRGAGCAIPGISGRGADSFREALYMWCPELNYRKGRPWWRLMTMIHCGGDTPMVRGTAVSNGGRATAP